MPPLDQWQHRVRANRVLIRLSGAAGFSSPIGCIGWERENRLPAVGLSKRLLALTPALSPRKGGSMHRAREFSCFLLWHRPMGTLVGRGRVRVHCH